MAPILDIAAAMKIRFWGVRGSIASPGLDTAEVGGNTSCVEVICGSTRIVLDAGTGLRELGNELLRSGEPLSMTMLLSHYHWDHIQGLPFFVPMYLKATDLSIIGAPSGVLSVKETLERQMCAPMFPVRFDQLGARVGLREVEPGTTFDVGEAKVTVARGNHPGGVVAYRIDHGGESVVYATDTEHYACVDPQLRKLSEGAAVLIYDSQYVPEEYPAKLGWGHSTYLAATELANSAGASELVLFHHDPSRKDAGVREIEGRAQALFPNTVAAREGLVIERGAGKLGKAVAA